MVLIKDELPRGCWRLGRIKELIQSEDGEIRSAKVLLPTGKLIGRPLNLLYPIECPENDNHRDKNKTGTGIPERDKQDYKQQEQRPKRQAAVKALDKIRSTLNDI